MERSDFEICKMPLATHQPRTDTLRLYTNCPDYVRRACQAQSLEIIGSYFANGSVLSFGEVLDGKHPTRITVRPTARAIDASSYAIQKGERSPVFVPNQVFYSIDEVSHAGEYRESTGERTMHPFTITLHEGAPGDSFTTGLYGMLAEDLLSICADFAARRFGAYSKVADRIDEAVQLIERAAGIIHGVRDDLNLKPDPRFKSDPPDQYPQICVACLTEHWLAKTAIRYSGSTFLFECPSCKKNVPACTIPRSWMESLIDQPDRCAEVTVCP